MTNKKRWQALAGILKESGEFDQSIEKRLYAVVGAKRSAESLLELLNRAISLLKESDTEEWGKRQLLEDGEHVLEQINDEFQALASILESADIGTPDW